MLNHQKNILTRQRGVTLIEILVVIIISSMLIVIAALGIGAFFRKYKELSAWSVLQQEGLDCLNTIKNGIGVGNVPDVEYYGVINALKLQLTNTTTTTAQGLKITPPTEAGLETPDYAHFYFYDGAVRCRYVHHGIQAASPLYIFPKQESLGKIKVEKFQVTKVNPENDVLAVRVELKARIETRKDEYKYINYKTIMVKK